MGSGPVGTDVRRGTSGTSRDVPIFVQFHKKICTDENKADLEKKNQERKTRKEQAT